MYTDRWPQAIGRKPEGSLLRARPLRGSWHGTKPQENRGALGQSLDDVGRPMDSPRSSRRERVTIGGQIFLLYNDNGLVQDALGILTRITE
jgi:hypothetical protein